ncbi:MAG: glycosyltransferase [Verrucomicrobia bacterium]|nr:MAG: glycosyltransferase [Verrucomicrobiota bacterium]
MAAIHQLVAGFSQGDAISNEARKLRRLFQSWGFASEIFCERQRILPELRREARDVTTAAQVVQPGDIALLHLSIGSPINEIFRQLNCRKALRYHNITPPEFFEDFFEPVARQLRTGREQLRTLAGAAEVNLAVSEFNAAELRAAGYGAVGVLPLMLDFAQLRGAASAATLAKYDDGRVNILFVGRGVPNKRIEDLLATFYYFQRYVEPNSRLIHVGSYAGLERYEALVFTRTRELQLAHVELTGSLPQAELNGCYRSAHAFLCMSEHEGFCIPLIEALVNDVPVLAYAAGAVPETLAGAGVLVKEKRFDLIAEMLGRLVHDERLRIAVRARQRERLASYENRNLESELRTHLALLLKK